MSTSPEKDLHSVYIDGEMPEDFISKYEAETAGNENAKAALEKMRSLHNFFQEDAKSKTVDKNFTDMSFERLKTKMSYAKTVSRAKKSSHVVPFVKYAASFASAAALFAVAFVPVYHRGILSAKTSEIAAIEIKSGNEIEPISEKQIVVDENFKRSDLSSRIAVASVKNETAAEKSSSESKTKAEESNESQIIEQKTVQASALVSGGNAGRRFSLPQVDPFRPDFSSSQIKISVPKFEEISDNFE